MGDWQEHGTFLLWDMVKECSEKRDAEDYRLYNDDYSTSDFYYEETLNWAKAMLELEEEEDRKKLVLEYIKELEEKKAALA